MRRLKELIERERVLEEQSLEMRAEGRAVIEGERSPMLRREEERRKAR